MLFLLGFLDAYLLDVHRQVLAVVVAVGQHFHVRRDQGGFLLELVLQEMDGVVNGAVEEPAHQTQREHVLRADDGFVVETRVFQALFRERRQRHGNDLHRLFQAQLHEGVVGLVEGFLQVLGREGVHVADNHGVVVDILHVHLQRRSVHRHQHVRFVTGRIDALTQLHLKTAHTAQRALRRADLGREIRKR